MNQHDGLRTRTAMQRAALAGESIASSGSMSASTGVAPARMTASTVAKAVIGVVMTSSPGPMSSARGRFPARRAVRDTDGMRREPDCTHSFSNAVTSCPSTRQPERSTRSHAASCAWTSSSGSEENWFIFTGMRFAAFMSSPIRRLARWPVSGAMLAVILQRARQPSFSPIFGCQSRMRRASDQLP